MNKNSKSFRRDPSLMAGRIKRYEKALIGLIEDAREPLESLVDVNKQLSRELEGIDLNTTLLMFNLNKILTDRILNPGLRVADDVVTQTYKAGGARADTFMGVSVNANIGNMPADKRALSVLKARSLTGLQGITDEMSKSIMQEITDGMLRGDSPRAVAKAISERVDISQSRSQVLARTETMKAYRTGSTNRYKQRGVEEVEWCAAMSARTCSECMALDGRRFPVGEEPHVHGGTDANCRCVLLPVIAPLEA